MWICLFSWPRQQTKAGCYPTVVNCIFLVLFFPLVNILATKWLPSNGPGETSGVCI